MPIVVSFEDPTLLMRLAANVGNSRQQEQLADRQAQADRQRFIQQQARQDQANYEDERNYRREQDADQRQADDIARLNKPLYAEDEFRYRQQLEEQEQANRAAQTAQANAEWDRRQQVLSALRPPARSQQAAPTPEQKAEQLRIEQDEQRHQRERRAMAQEKIFTLRGYSPEQAAAAADLVRAGDNSPTLPPANTPASSGENDKRNAARLKLAEYDLKDAEDWLEKVKESDWTKERQQNLAAALAKYEAARGKVRAAYEAMAYPAQANMGQPTTQPAPATQPTNPEADAFMQLLRQEMQAGNIPQKPGSMPSNEMPPPMYDSPLLNQPVTGPKPGRGQFKARMSDGSIHIIDKATGQSVWKDR